VPKIAKTVVKAGSWFCSILPFIYKSTTYILCAASKKKPEKFPRLSFV